MRISDWSSDVCSSDLIVAALDAGARRHLDAFGQQRERPRAELVRLALQRMRGKDERGRIGAPHRVFDRRDRFHAVFVEIAENAHETGAQLAAGRSEEHTSDLQSLMRISYALFCLKTKNKLTTHHAPTTQTTL